MSTNYFYDAAMNSMTALCRVGVSQANIRVEMPPNEFQHWLHNPELVKSMYADVIDNEIVVWGPRQVKMIICAKAVP